MLQEAVLSYILMDYFYLWIMERPYITAEGSVPNFKILGLSLTFGIY